VQTRLQKQKPNPDGSLPYKSFLDAVRQVAVKEGPLAFYKGIGTYIVRIAPHAFMTLIFLDAANAKIGGVVKEMRAKEAAAAMVAAGGATPATAAVAAPSAAAATATTAAAAKLQ
jgi:hypothetical protein